MEHTRVKDVVASYAIAIDERDWDGVAACFLGEATIDGTQFSGLVQDYLPALRGAVERFSTTMHFIGTQLVLHETDSEATTKSYAIAVHLSASPDVDDMTIGVRYDDTMRLVDGRWVIVKRKVHGLWSRNVADLVDLSPTLAGAP